MTPVEVAAVVVAAVLGGAVQATLGFGGSFIAVPVLAVLLPQAVPAGMLIGLLPLTTLIAWRDRAAIDGDAVWRIAIARVPGIALGTAVVAIAPTRVITLVVAASLGVAVLAAASGWEVRTTPWSQRLVGAVSGFTGTAAALGGPPLALLYRSSGGADRRGTMSAVFTIGIVIALAMLAAAGEVDSRHALPGVVVGVGLLVGGVVAVPVVRRAGDDALRRGVLAWAAVGAVVAAARALLT